MSQPRLPHRTVASCVGALLLVAAAAKTSQAGYAPVTVHYALDVPAARLGLVAWELTLLTGR